MPVFRHLFFLIASSSGGQVSNPSTYIEFTNGTKEPLFVPSGTQSGYKANGSFVVPVNGTVFITADFDVRKSVVKSGHNHKWILKPVIRLVVSDQAGSIVGTLAGLKVGKQYIAYAYANDTNTAEEAALPAEGEAQFPNAISSTLVHEEGAFTLAYLAPGTYDLHIAAYENGSFVEMVGYIENVNVQSLQQSNVESTLLP